MTKRITPEMVIEAYQQHTELKPVKGVYIQVVEGGIEVCGLAAVAAMNGFDVEEYPSPVGDFLISRIGVSRDYIWGFERGFDKQGAKGQVQNTDFMVGYEDGSAAAKLVFGEPADE